ncbi:MAG: hypothetical protein U5P10_13730 [Spirochaetia bacterium]|nr:hypothetical protein [Spirochaetia bacterium]
MEGKLGGTESSETAAESRCAAGPGNEAAGAEGCSGMSRLAQLPSSKKARVSSSRVGRSRRVLRPAAAMRPANRPPVE